MRVALELQPACGKRSGIGNYTYELARRLRDGDGLEFCGNLFNFLGRNDNSALLGALEMPVRTCRAFPYGVYRRVWRLLPIPYQALFKGRADLSVFFNYIVPPRVSGRIVTTVYDMTYLRFPETMDAKNRRRLERDMRHSLERSDAVLTISSFSKREIVELTGFPAERVYVAPCAPSLADETADFEETAAQLGIEGPYILYVGTIEPRKNLERLIRAFALLKREQGIPHRLVLAGGKGWLSEDIYRAAQGVPGVVMTGYLTDAQKNALYRRADAFAYPSLYEGFGMPPLEAMAFGCPVVCANAASLPEVVGDAAELVDPLDEADIARGLYRVLGDPERARELSRKGSKQAAKFTWDASAGALERVCWAVLEGV